MKSGAYFGLFFSFQTWMKHFCLAKCVSASSPTPVAGKSPIDFSGSRTGHQLDPTSYLKVLFFPGVNKCSSVQITVLLGVIFYW